MKISDNEIVNNIHDNLRQEIKSLSDQINKIKGILRDQDELIMEKFSEILSDSLSNHFM
jgi:iron-sulfur cluster repair protein YtfE (RIC family)